jgi:hypothetical protein
MATYFPVCSSQSDQPDISYFPSIATPITKPGANDKVVLVAGNAYSHRE